MQTMQDNKNIRGFIFDWGGVIIDEPTNDLLSYCAKALQLPHGGEALISRYLPKFQNGSVDENELWKIVIQESQIASQTSARDYKSESLWGEAVRTVFRFRQSVRNHMQRLHEQGYRIGFLSNTEPAAADFFYERKMESWFDGTVLSCEDKLAKPQAEIYHLCCKRMNCAPETTCMLDDRPENIQGAKDAGLNAFLVQSESALNEFLCQF